MESRIADAPAAISPEGEQVKKLKRGFDLNIFGEAPQEAPASVSVSRYAIQPPNFLGLAPMPKLVVQEGEHIKAGDALFYDKIRPDVFFAAPVSGELIAVNRGERRAIQEVVILADKNLEYRKYERIPVLEHSSREDLLAFLKESGAWALFRQRPYNLLADPNQIPRDIFVSTFDTAPLAPNLSLVVQGREAAFQKGLDVLAKLTTGQVYLGLDARGKYAIPAAFSQAQGVNKVGFKGKHPAGNVGVQIHHIRPIRSKEKVWTLGVQEVISLGTLFLEGKYDMSRVIALTGASLSQPTYVRTYAGANIGDLLKGQTVADNSRIISGDVLSGKTKTNEQFLDFYDDQVTVIPEGNDYEMFGWLLPMSARPSTSRTFFSSILPFGWIYNVNTNTRGEKRAFVVTGQYEDVLPMDLYPQHLLKAIITNDIERIEGLGIHEVVEEDLALCEFACTSKQPLQKILREGINMMIKEGL
jgi:Na+-transporting NADH:ubiquinone oxidoreductase subunit A